MRDHEYLVESNVPFPDLDRWSPNIDQALTFPSYFLAGRVSFFVGGCAIKVSPKLWHELHLGDNRA